jgi:hypothetical protein
MGADSWDFVQSGSPQNLIRTEGVTDVDVWVGLDITNTTGGSGRQLAIVIRESNNNPYYYGEIFDAGGGGFLHIEHYDGVNYNAIASVMYGAFPMNTSVTEHLTARAGASPVFAFGINSMSLNSPAAGYVSGELILIATGNCSGSVRYIAIIGS